MVLEIDVETQCKHIVVAGEIAAVAEALVSGELHFLLHLLMLIEGVEVSHVEMHLVGEVDHSTATY